MNVDECTVLYFGHLFGHLWSHVRPSTLWMHASAVRLCGFPLPHCASETVSHCTHCTHCIMRCVSCSSSWSRGTTRGSRHTFFVTLFTCSHQIHIRFRSIRKVFSEKISYHILSSFSASPSLVRSGMVFLDQHWSAWSETWSATRSWWLDHNSRCSRCSRCFEVYASANFFRLRCGCTI